MGSSDRVPAGGTSTAGLGLHRVKAFFIVLAIWAAVYLPGLGTPELDGGEGRRVLPALTMMETGDWIVPHMGGVPYCRKPPVINWLIAASFTLTGRQSEESARLCSALFTLAAAGLLIWLPGRWPSPAGRLISAVAFVTSFGLIKEGRRIEIDGVYASLALMTIAWWLNAWVTRGSRWSLWVVPSLFLAVGILTKGPLILLLYYLTVICVLACSKRLRAMLSIPHAAGVILCLGVPLAWALLASRQAGADQVTAQTSNDILLRFVPGRIDLLRWGRNVLGALLLFLPWLALIPVLWKREFLAYLPAGQTPVFKGSRLSLCLGFGVIALLPGTRPHYVLPVTGVAVVLLGWLLSAVPSLPDGGRGWRSVILVGALTAGAGALAGIAFGDAGVHGLIAAAVAIGLTVIVFRRREALRTPVSLSAVSGALIAVFAIEYAAFVLPRDVRHERYRPVAAEINALVPDGESVYAFRPGDRHTCQNLLFYVSPSPRYLTEPRQIDSRVRYLLIHEADYEKLADEAGLASRHPTSLYRFTQGHAQEEFQLVKLSASPAGWAGGQTPLDGNGSGDEIR